MGDGMREYSSRCMSPTSSNALLAPELCRNQKVDCELHYSSKLLLCKVVIRKSCIGNPNRIHKVNMRLHLFPHRSSIYKKGKVKKSHSPCHIPLATF